MSKESPGCATTSASERAVCEELDNVRQRLLTFDHRWTGSVDKTILARAGFTYTGIGDKVECDQCGLKLLNWTSTDDPLHEHATRRPLCPFINSRYRQLGQTKPPKHPQYQQLQDRLDSFESWPGRYVPKTPEELAAAGFFYIGSADRVTCFQCGITLRDWEEEHDPVTEHQRYSENCQFINKTDIKQLGITTRITSSEGNPETVGDNPSTHMTEGACALPTTSTFEHVQVASAGKSANLAPWTIGDEDPLTHAKPNQLSSAPSATRTSTSGISVTTEAPTETTARSLGRMSLDNTSSNELEEENKLLREKRRCRVCREKGASILFLPCGHLVTCSECAPKVSECVVCGKTILGTVKTFFT